MNTPLKYKLVDKHGNMIARFRYSYDAAHMGAYYDESKIYNMQWGSKGRIVATNKIASSESLSSQIDDNEARIMKELRAEAEQWHDGQSQAERMAKLNAEIGID